MTDIFSQVISIAVEVLGQENAGKLQDALRGLGDAGAAADAKLGPLVDELTKLGTTSLKVQQAIDLSKRIETNNAALDDAKKALADLNKEFDKTDKTSSDVNVAFQQAEKNVKALAGEQLKLQNAFASSVTELKAAGVNTNNLNAANEQLKKDTAAVAEQITSQANASSKAATSAKELGQSTAQAGKEAKTTGGLFSELRDNLGKIVSIAAAVKAALAGIQIGKDAFKEASDVEASLSRVQAIAKSTSDSFDALSDQIEKSARAANVSTADAASAAAALAEQGQTAEEIFHTLTPTILLARDANLDLATAAGIVDDTLDQFGLSADQATTIVDKLVVAAKGSKDGLAGMSQALKQLAPDARALGLDFDQLVSLLGLLQQNGIDASKATRGLRTILQDLQDPTSKLSTELGALGDHSADFSKAIDAIRNAGAGGQKALLSLDGAARSLVLFLVNQGPGALDTFAESLQNVQGEALKTREAIDNNLKGSFTSLENALDALGAGLAKTALAPLRDEFQKLSVQLNAFADSPAFAKLQGALTELFTQGVAAFDKFIQNVDFQGFVDNATTSIKQAGQTIGEFKDDLASVATALNTVGAALGVIFRAGVIVFDALKTSVAGTLLVFAELSLQASRVSDRLRGIPTSDTTRAFEQLVVSAKKAATDGLAGMSANSGKLAGDLETLGGQSEDTAKKIDGLKASFDNVKAGVGTTADTFALTVSDFNALTGAVENSANALGILPGIFNDTAVATQAAAAAATEHANAIVEARQAVADARAELDKLVVSGTASGEAMQKAAADYQTAQNALTQLTSSSGDAVDSQRQLEQAFKSLHLTTQSDLVAASNQAKTALETIHQAFLSGKASVEDQRRAFEAWAQTVRQSVADSDSSVKAQAESTIAAEAAAIGFTDASAKAGATAAQAGTDTADAFDKAADSIQGASDAAGNLAENATDAAAGIKDLGDGATSAASATGVAANALQGIVLLSNEQLHVLSEIGKEFLSGAISGEQYAERVKVALGGVDEALEKQKQNLREFQDELDQLNSDIAGQTGDAQGQENIRHQQKLRDLEDEFEVQGKFTLAQYKQLVDAENRLHNLKLSNTQQEQKAAGEGSGQGGGGGEGGGQHAPEEPPPPPEPAEAPPKSSAGGTTVRGAAVTVNLTVNGLLDRAGTEQLARQIKKIFDDIDGRS